MTRRKGHKSPRGIAQKKTSKPTITEPQEYWPASPPIATSRAARNEPKPERVAEPEDGIASVDQPERCPARLDLELDVTVFFKSRLPDRLLELCSLRQTLDLRLTNSFQARLTEPEMKAFYADGFKSSAIREKWEQAIIDLAGRYGTLILVSDNVLRTVHLWRTEVGDSGPSLPMLRRFFSTILEEAEVRWGEKKSPITEDYAVCKPVAVGELKKLQSELQRTGLRTSAEVIELLRRLVTIHECPWLYQNRAELFFFLESVPHTALGFGGNQPLLNPNGDPVESVSATNFFYHLVAHSTNRTFESVRQDISRASANSARRR